MISWTSLAASAALLLVWACAPGDSDPPPVAGDAAVPEPGLRWITFSGYAWWVKASESPVGPGPNPFAPENVWVDDDGRLHLRIARSPNGWSCAEIVSRRSFGYGTYRFELASNAAGLDRNAVLGLFTWSDDPVHAHREIDIEVSRWGAEDNDPLQYVVQPWQRSGSMHRFGLGTSLHGSVHSFRWGPDAIDFASATSSGERTAWAYEGGVPPAGDENARLNLWLLGGQPPAGDGELEVVVRRFTFTPGSLADPDDAARPSTAAGREAASGRIAPAEDARGTSAS